MLMTSAASSRQAWRAAGTGRLLALVILDAQLSRMEAIRSRRRPGCQRGDDSLEKRPGNWLAKGWMRLRAYPKELHQHRALETFGLTVNCLVRKRGSVIIPESSLQ